MSTVISAILSNLDELDARIPAIRDGDREAIHDGRVATRRLRAALPLVGSETDTDESRALTTMVKTLGRALGKARDKDEALALLEKIERRSPVTAPATASLRARLFPQQLRQRRRLIKTVESLDLNVLTQLRRALQPDGGRRHRAWNASMQSRLASTVNESAAMVRQKVHHASGVYFPNRAHRARIAIKKLRYGAELIEPGVPGRKSALRALKSAQQSLGSVHDREMLRRMVTETSARDDIPAARELAQILEAESRALFDEYREMRSAVAGACEKLEAWSRRVSEPRRVPRLLVVSAVALPSAAIYLASRARRAS